MLKPRLSVTLELSCLVLVRVGVMQLDLTWNPSSCFETQSSMCLMGVEDMQTTRAIPDKHMKCPS